MTSLLGTTTSNSAVHEDALNDPAVTSAVERAREAAVKYYQDKIPYPKECEKNSPECKREKGVTDVLQLKIPHDTLASVLKREETFRMSPQVQALYDEFEHPPPCIEGEMQTRALEEHGLCRCYLNRYWRTAQYVDKSNHPELWNSVVYLRYYDRYIENWDVPCQKRNQKIPKIPVIPTNQDDENSFEAVDMMEKYHTKGRPLVVVSGSQS
jgi:hypothetical protein